MAIACEAGLEDLADATDDALADARLGAGFWRLWAASAVSNAGDGLFAVAFPLMVASLTRDPLLVAGVVFIQRLPWLLFALLAGAFADRLNRAVTMAVVDILRGAAVLVLGWSAAVGEPSLPLMYLVAFLLGSGETMFSAANHAAIPGVVEERHLDRANGYLFSTETAGAELVGPTVGGALFALSAPAPFVADGLTFIISALLLWRLRARLPAPNESLGSTLRGDIAEGLAFFRASVRLRIIARLVAVFAFWQAAVMGILVLFAVDELGLSGAGYGLFVALGAIGNIVGGVLASRVRNRVGTVGILLGSGALAACGYLVIAAAPVAGVAVFGLLLESFAVACGSVATMALRQSLVPDRLRGRVGNIVRMFIWGSIPLGSLVGGGLAALCGLRAAVAIAGAAQVLALIKLAPQVVRHFGQSASVIDLREPATVAA